MNQTDYYFDAVVFAICELDLDVPDNATLDEIRDAAYNYAHGETFAEFGDTNEVELTASQFAYIENRLEEYFS